jgi:hypothetical protein
MMEALVNLIRNYFNYRNLEAFLSEEKAKTTLKAAIVMVVLAQLVSFFSVVISTLVGALFDPEIAALISLTSLFMFLLEAIIGIVFFFFFSGFLHLLSKLLGGKGTYLELTFVLAVVSLAANLVASPFLLVLEINTFFELIGSLGLLLLTFYMIFAQYKTLKAVHGLSKLRAIVAVFIIWMMMTIFLAMFYLMTLPLQPVA